MKPDKTRAPGRVIPAELAGGPETDGSQNGYLDGALRALEELNSSNLRIRWRELFGRNAPTRLGPDLLRRAIAFRLQEMTLGGLSRQAQIRLKAVSHQSQKIRTGQTVGSTPALVKPGTRFVREWQGSLHEVMAIDTGDFVYRGKTYKSLSTLAKEITGTHQSGPRFFGLKRTGSRLVASEQSDGR